MASCVIFDQHPRLGGSVLVNWSGQVDGLQTQTMRHGFGTATFFKPLPIHLARFWYSRLRSAHLSVSDDGRQVYEGRIEDVTMVPDSDEQSGLAITAYGYWRAFNVLNIADWSDSAVDQWEVVQETEEATRRGDLYTTDQDQRIYMAFTKGVGYANDRILTVVRRVAPIVGIRKWQTFSFDYDVVLDSMHCLNISLWDEGFTNAVSLEDINGPLTATGTKTYTFSGTPRAWIGVQLYDTRPTTTLTANEVNGTNVILAIASTADMIRGHEIHFDGDEPEDAFVKAIFSPTSAMVKDLGGDHVAGEIISYVYGQETGTHRAILTNLRAKTISGTTLDPAEVYKSLVGTAALFNPTQINANTSLIQEQGIDLRQYSYDYSELGAIIEYLTGLGDLSGRQWDAAVWEEQVLYVKPRGADARTFQIMETPEISTVLDRLYTRIIPLYEDANGQRAVGTTQVSIAAEQVNGLVRHATISVPTTNKTEAEALANAHLVYTTKVGARGEITTDRIFQGGALVPPDMVRPGDILQCVTMPTTGDVTVDLSRSLYVDEMTFDHESGMGTFVPENPIPRIDTALAQRDVQGLNNG